MPLFGFLRNRRQSSGVMPGTPSHGTDLSLTPRPHTAHALSNTATPAPGSPLHDRRLTQSQGRKRKMPPPGNNGRAAWEHSDKRQKRHDVPPVTPRQKTSVPTSNGSWISKLKRLSSSFRADFIHVKREHNDDDDDDVNMENVPPHAPLDQPMATVEHDSDSVTMADDSIVVTSSKAPGSAGGEEDDDDSQYVDGETLLGGSPEPEIESDEDEFDDNDADIVEEDWEWLFEVEPPVPDAAAVASDAWSVDSDELEAYEEGVASIEGYDDGWTADEKRLHRLLALRGFHPLLPGTWMRDFLGVPMYPYLFAPLDVDESDARPVTITNYGSQFHATKALRALFDLQARVSGLRQTGHNTARIGAIIERELRRYIAWAAADAGLDQCGPLAAMPNVAAKQFLVGDDGSGGGGGRSGRGRRGRRQRQRQQKPLDRRVQEYFGDWVARYRSYYATLPEYEVEGSDGSETGETRRLRPPRLLYGFVIVQHAVMLMVVDASAPESGGYERFVVPATATTSGHAVRRKRRRHPHPRCLADFNLSHGDRWLDASLSVAIPVHMARAAQMRCRAGLKLPSTRVDAVDDDA